MSYMQTFRIEYLDANGQEVFQIYRNYIGTATGLREQVLDDIDKGHYDSRVIDVRVIQTSGTTV